MKTTIANLAALVYLLPGIMALTMNTPFGVTQCQPQMLTWADGAPPYYVTIIPGGQPSAAPLRSWEPQTGNSLTWQVDLPAGTEITLQVKDSTGNTAFSDKVKVQQATPGSACSQNADALATAAAPGTTAASGSAAGSSGQSAASRPVASGTPSGNAVGQTGNVARPASSSGAPAAAVGTSNTPRPSATSASSGAVSNLKIGSAAVAGVVGLVAAFFL